MTLEEKTDFRERVVVRLRQQQGIPFCHQGRCPEQGFDCVGLPSWCLLQEGYVPEDAEKFSRRRYRRRPRPEELAEVLGGECVQVEDGVLLPLDLLLIDLQPPYSDDQASHIAVVTYADSDTQLIIQTHRIWDEVREHSYTPEWQTMTTSAWRLKCLA